MTVLDEVLRLQALVAELGEHVGAMTAGATERHNGELRRAWEHAKAMERDRDGLRVTLEAMRVSTGADRGLAQAEQGSPFGTTHSAL